MRYIRKFPKLIQNFIYEFSIVSACLKYIGMRHRLPFSATLNRTRMLQENQGLVHNLLLERKFKPHGQVELLRLQFEDDISTIMAIDRPVVFAFNHIHDFIRPLLTCKDVIPRDRSVTIVATEDMIGTWNIDSKILAKSIAKYVDRDVDIVINEGRNVGRSLTRKLLQNHVIFLFWDVPETFGRPSCQTFLGRRANFAAGWIYMACRCNALVVTPRLINRRMDTLEANIIMDFGNFLTTAEAEAAFFANAIPALEDQVMQEPWSWHMWPKMNQFLHELVPDRKVN